MAQNDKHQGHLIRYYRIFKFCFPCFFSGQSLVDAGESFKRLAEVKYSLEENVKQNFLEPWTHLQTKDLKEVNVSIHIVDRTFYCLRINLPITNLDLPCLTYILRMGPW